jgi:uncharacterized protein YdeI (BOF family)
MQWVLLLPVLAVLAGCSRDGTRELGNHFDEGAVATTALARQTNVNADIIVHGKMTQKCPVAGCWFMLQDADGLIKVDTKNSGFVVVDVPLQSHVTVAGRVATNGNERFIDAKGLRY